MTAVSDLSFQVGDGEICGFLGPNGAGKTTTMQMMTGCLAPTEGTVKIDGYDIFRDPVPAKKTIGYLPEVPPLYPDLTVDEYLRFAAALKKVPKAARSAELDRVLSALELSEERHRLIRNLSKGYRQRVGFAGALIGDPKTLFLDEPMSGLDPKQINAMRDLIRELGRTHTIFLSSHILSEVAEICTRVLILSGGRAVAMDTPDRLCGQGAGVLLIETAGSASQVREALGGVADTEEAEIEERGGRVYIRILMPEGEDIRSRVSSALAAGGCPVLEMRAEKASLEDIFILLTEEDAEEETEEDAEEETRALKGADDDSDL